MGRQKKGRALDGVLLLDKPLGLSSNHALMRAKRLFFAAKAGHTGSLDPLATGLLPICFGEATKFSQFLLDADKRYQCTFRLGETTSTGDADGEVLSQTNTDGLTRDQVQSALAQLEGDIMQVPPMYSALKHQGQPLYKLAREGKEVERKARPVSIYGIELLAFRPGAAAEVDVEVHCSKGTYIRTLAEDLGAALGCGARVDALRRVATGLFDLSRATTLEALEAERGEGLAEQLDHHLLPSDAPVASLPALILPEASGYYFRLGNPVMDPQVYRLGDEGDMVRVFLGDEKQFLGLGELTDDGQVAPRRLVANQAVVGSPDPICS
ncbi:tRNA pseudouridine(55) synthase TruB [Marinimicrobium sp. ABcell2]|uniref:tRNA pseudouridine(55) synthase TruB n=1 Tax=Marinimicrobium sp. ABcell2 TaxID=3069751 RepID=UPI0027B7B561|nr:tRNA pseudouridine(55) synthase TruB [Marinimicrobium sp. ABcell2]MDQ2076314.1 tRNA pseudouridine(55) synthase TruB [Marinimicrobium sp. ABcell2]